MIVFQIQLEKLESIVHTIIYDLFIFTNGYDNIISGQWSVVSGQWSVDSGQWTVGSNVFAFGSANVARMVV